MININFYHIYVCSKSGLRIADKIAFFYGDSNLRSFYSEELYCRLFLIIPLEWIFLRHPMGNKIMRKEMDIYTVKRAEMKRVQ